MERNAESLCWNASLIAAESGRSDLGRLCYARGPQRSHAEVSNFLAGAMAQAVTLA